MSEPQTASPPGPPQQTAPHQELPRPAAAQPRAEARSSYRTAYILCILLGWMGGHRYYLRLWGTAILYNCSFGLFGIGILVDLLTLPLLVRERRDIEAGIPLPPVQAAWADEEKVTWWNRFQLLLRYAILLLSPPITVILGLSFGQEIAVVLVFLILGFSLLVGSIGRGLYGLEDLKELAGRFHMLELAVKALAITSRIEEHYTEHRTGSVFYYLLYPVLAPLAMVFSPRARNEFRQYLSLFFAMVVGVVAQNIWSFKTIFLSGEANHLVFGLFVSFFLGLAGIVLFFACLVPMVSSSFYLSKTGRSLSLRSTAAVALVICGWAVVWSWSGDSVPVRGTLTMLEKFNDEAFKDDFTAASKLFLSGEMDRIRQGEMDRVRGVAEQREAHDDKADDSPAEVHRWKKPPSQYAGQTVFAEAKLTQWYRNLVSGMIRDEESPALSVLAVYPDSAELPWLAIRLDPDPLSMRGALGGVVLLYVVSPHSGQVFARWDELVRHVEQVPTGRNERSFLDCFELPGSESTQDRVEKVIKKSAELPKLTRFLLADDLQYVPILGPLDAGFEKSITLWQRLKLAPIYQEFRDDTGTNKVMARIVAAEADRIQLERADGRNRVWVPIHRLGAVEKARVQQWKTKQGVLPDIPVP